MKVIIKNIYWVLLISANFAVAQNEFAGQTYGSFKPEKGEKYIVSAWVKEIHDTQQMSYVNSSVSVHFSTTTPIVNTFLPSGDIIDGWQRIVGILTIPTTSPNIDIRLNNNNGQKMVYFDDVRFFPYNGNLKSFVYDKNSQQLLAELDENNYATFYEYDLEGGLVRVKKETEKGVYTIQETRSGNAK